MDKINVTKEEISKYIDYLNTISEEISDNEKIVLDNFFDKTNNSVIDSILQRYKSILCDDNRSSKNDKKYQPNKKFIISVPAVKFPNMNHEYAALYYLESKYNEKFKELNLESIGVLNPHFIPSTTNFPNDLFINYMCNDPKRSFKNSSFGYRLEVSVDYRKINSKDKVVKTK